jgi:hypothetical protein
MYIKMGFGDFWLWWDGEPLHRGLAGCSRTSPNSEYVHESILSTNPSRETLLRCFMGGVGYRYQEMDNVPFLEEPRRPKHSTQPHPEHNQYIRSERLLVIMSYHKLLDSTEQ